MKSHKNADISPLNEIGIYAETLRTGIPINYRQLVIKGGNKRNAKRSIPVIELMKVSENKGCLTKDSCRNSPEIHCWFQCAHIQSNTTGICYCKLVPGARLLPKPTAQTPLGKLRFVLPGLCEKQLKMTRAIQIVLWLYHTIQYSVLGK